MSIPKEPRQLMINLMYLVLTAMLALNVSAEIMNAFKVIDDSLKESTTTANLAIDAQAEALRDVLKKPEKANFRGLGTGADAIRAASSAFIESVEALKIQLIDEAGDKDGALSDGDYMYLGTPKQTYKGKKNKDVTTRLLVDQGLGDSLRANVERTRQEFIDIYRRTLSDPTTAAAVGYRTATGAIDKAKIEQDIAKFEQAVVLKTESDSVWRAQAGPDKKTWSQYRFKQLPLISALPLLTKYQADAKNAEAFAVSEFAKKVGGLEIVFDQFFPVVNADKSYVVGGETINAKVSVGTYSSSLDPSNVSISAGGTPLRVGADGIATYTINGSGSGPKTVPFTVSVKNPLTGEVKTGKSEFTYEVGSRSVAVSADKMNVFYLGVDNPLTVSAGGVSSNSVRVSGSGPISVSGSYPKFVVKGSSPGEAKITVTGGGQTLGSFDFRVKRIPDPVAMLGNREEGTIGNGEFMAQRGLAAILQNFDFDARCEIQGYTMVRVAQRQDPVTVVNSGGSYGGDAERIARAAKPGDTYYFRDVKGRCPGDGAGRKLNSLVFTIR